MPLHKVTVCVVGIVKSNNNCYNLQTLDFVKQMPIVL